MVQKIYDVFWILLVLTVSVTCVTSSTGGATVEFGTGSPTLQTRIALNSTAYPEVTMVYDLHGAKGASYSLQIDLYATTARQQEQYAGKLFAQQYTFRDGPYDSALTFPPCFIMIKMKPYLDGINFTALRSLVVSANYSGVSGSLKFSWLDAPVVYLSLPSVGATVSGDASLVDAVSMVLVNNGTLPFNTNSTMLSWAQAGLLFIVRTYNGSCNLVTMVDSLQTRTSVQLLDQLQPGAQMVLLLGRGTMDKTIFTLTVNSGVSPNPGPDTNNPLPLTDGEMAAIGIGCFILLATIIYLCLFRHKSPLPWCKKPQARADDQDRLLGSGYQPPSSTFVPDA